MTVGETQKIIESLAPKEIAWGKDNIGLQIGDKKKNVRKIFVTLDVTKKIVKEACSKKVDLIISHHPLIFKPLTSITKKDKCGEIIYLLINNNISLLVAHTNLDFTNYGVSYSLAKQLGLQNIDILLKNYKVQKKVVVFVPVDNIDKVMTAMSEAGAGKIGKYEMCSFQTTGRGTFKGAVDTEPFIGKAGNLEKVTEAKLEMIVPSWKLNDVLTAMKAAHPYEEIAYDIYDLENFSNDYGTGIIGNYSKKILLKEFLNRICKYLKVPLIRYVGDTQKKIQRIAVCGGGGIELLPVAVKEKADAFVTADISYHKFQDASNEIALIDAGHFETEFPVVKHVTGYLDKHFKAMKEKIIIYTSGHEDNQVKYYMR